MRPIPAAAAALAAAAFATPAPAQESAAPWSAVWTASPQAVWRDETIFPTGLPARIAGATIRQPLTLGYPADRLRLLLSNAHGVRPLPIEAATLARSVGGATVEDPQPVRFGGETRVTIAPGAQALSDPLPFPAEAGTRVAATLTYGPGAVAEDFHWDARETGYVIEADRPDPVVLAETPARVTLSAVFSDRPARAGVIAMGDSLTDGNGAPMDAMARWPDFLARAMAPQGIAVVNAGISGGRLLSDGMGRSVLARLERDVLASPGADTLVLLIGTNDIAWPGTIFAPDEAPMTLARLQAGLLQAAARVRAAGLRLIVGTAPPFRGALPGTPLEGAYWSPAKDALRRELNAWLRAATFHDGLADFDRALSDPADDARLNPLHDSGDHLHPSPEGNRAMARVVEALLTEAPDPR
ncbi:SGNH/GDSL hydrolase family protein [Albimonas pacifica]|uniref:Lysophospholipase L1 n=1 Tax=Albimonas pacifica TaxID=1114924 RepID=A0A1I3MB98_9RHOB|nr:SGNH/GDSL hydrolase family protein [Albimonas pacifica]SFI94263.1 Lysophospholipase L1 [Albimonas pacifica]